MGYDGTLKFDTSIDSSGFQSGINKISSCASTALKATSAIIGGAASAVVGIGTAAIKTGADFEAAMSNVAAISGATGDDLKSLTDKAKEMGAKTKFSATESAEAFSYMAMAGWKTTDMLEGIEGIMNLAAASGEDLATTSDIVTDALTAFGLSAKDSTHFADVLAQASSNANTNVGLMGETFKYVAPVAGALGFSAEDCATAIGLMANSGIKASQAGTSLRSIITRMAKPTKDVQGAMDALGVSLTNSDGSMKSLNEIMVDLRKGFAGLTADQKAQMAATLGGQEAMSGLLAIVNASDEDFASLTDSIANCDGAAQKMADTMNDNLSGQITILKSGLEGLAISLYEEMATPLKNVVKVDVAVSTGTEHFSLTEKDQINLFGKKMQLLAGEEKLEYHEDGQPCKYFSAADMQKIVDTAMFYVSYNTTYCNALNMWIKSISKASELEQIQWGTKIPEEFQNEVLKDYVKAMASGGVA